MAMTELNISLGSNLARGFDKNLVFIDEVIDWFILNNIIPPIPYLRRESASSRSGVLTTTTITLMVSFENDNDALLFKLRWL